MNALSQNILTSIVFAGAVLMPQAAGAFRVPADAILNSYSLPDGTPVCVVMNNNNYESVPDGKGGWTFNRTPRPVAVDCRTGMIIPEEHVPTRPSVEPTPEPEPEPTPEETKAEQCRQIREGAREGLADSWGPGMAVDVAIMSAIACHLFL